MDTYQLEELSLSVPEAILLHCKEADAMQRGVEWTQDDTVLYSQEIEDVKRMECETFKQSWTGCFDVGVAESLLSRSQLAFFRLDGYSVGQALFAEREAASSPL